MEEEVNCRNLHHGLSFTSECVTDVSPIVLTQKWTICNFDNILKLSKPGDCMRSKVFQDDALSDVCWQLCLYPGGKREENAGNVSLFLKMSSRDISNAVLIKAEYRFYFLDDNEEARFSNINVGEFHARPPKGGHSWGLRNIPMQKVKNSLRDDKSLVISCVIEVMPTWSNAKPTSIVPVVPNSERKDFASIPETDLMPNPTDVHPGHNDLIEDFKNLTLDGDDSAKYDEEFDAELVD